MWKFITNHVCIKHDEIALQSLKTAQYKSKQLKPYGMVDVEPSVENRLYIVCLQACLSEMHS